MARASGEERLLLIPSTPVPVLREELVPKSGSGKTMSDVGVIGDTEGNWPLAAEKVDVASVMVTGEFQTVVVDVVAS